MKCEDCQKEDTRECLTCTDPEKDEMMIKLQEILAKEEERMKGVEPIDGNRINAIQGY
jgi:hypothetical protein